MRSRPTGRRTGPDRSPLQSRASCRLAIAKARGKLRRPHAVCKVRVGRRPDTGKGPFARSPQSTINDWRKTYSNHLAMGRTTKRPGGRRRGTDAAAIQQGPIEGHAGPTSTHHTRGRLEPEEDLMDRLRRMKPSRGALNPPPPACGGATSAYPRQADHPGRREVTTGGADGKGELPTCPRGRAPLTKPAGLQPVRHMNIVQEPVPAGALRRP